MDDNKPTMKQALDAAATPVKPRRFDSRKVAMRGQHQERPRGITPEGIRILDFMRTNSVKGNYKDYVLFVADRMWDAWGEYRIPRKPQTGDPEAAVDMVALVHKKDLHNVIGQDHARKFWHLGLKRRTSFGAKK